MSIPSFGWNNRTEQSTECQSQCCILAQAARTVWVNWGKLWMETVTRPRTHRRHSTHKKCHCMKISFHNFPSIFKRKYEKLLDIPIVGGLSIVAARFVYSRRWSPIDVHFTLARWQSPSTLSIPLSLASFCVNNSVFNACAFHHLFSLTIGIRREKNNCNN